ncbi:MAG: pyridoxal 5'-phosphate synthase glutaminase subunit PdxT [Agathobacter sp.]|nr:pyridoxal 5'-phosphate synthase glutaminase subunit PdxT [Agathobacter sp.]
MKIGILAVQGAFIEHEKIIKELGADCIEIRKKEQLEYIDGIILPGGESTVQGQLIRKLEILEPLKEMINNGLPVLATCAGAILLSQTIENGDEAHLGTLPVEIKRNAYGRQLSSFVTNANIDGIGEFPMVFIRAPYISSVSENVRILATVDEHIVAVQYKNQIGMSFHPELTSDIRIHKYFLDIAKEYNRK